METYAVPLSLLAIEEGKVHPLALHRAARRLNNQVLLAYWRYPYWAVHGRLQGIVFTTVPLP